MNDRPKRNPLAGKAPQEATSGQNVPKSGERANAGTRHSMAALYLDNWIQRKVIYGKKQPGTNIPQHEVEALARCLLPEIPKFFESPEGQKEFEE